jgi:hypothetical protein
LPDGAPALVLRGFAIYALRVDGRRAVHSEPPYSGGTPRCERIEALLARRAGQPNLHITESPATRSFIITNVTRVFPLGVWKPTARPSSRGEKCGRRICRLDGCHDVSLYGAARPRRQGASGAGRHAPARRLLSHGAFARSVNVGVKVLKQLWLVV